ncbi:uncharacterized protein TNCV_3888011 [Trichonephila clavipes]|nr:uncharacterized protein TNCV_3888011 [Trichonephila clavipes]
MSRSGGQSEAGPPVCNGTLYHHTSCGSGVSLLIKGRIEAFTTGFPHTNTIAITAEIESGFVTKEDRVSFRCSFLMRSTTPNGGVDGWASRTAHVMGAAIPNVLQSDAFVWFEKTQGALVMALQAPGGQSMKQLAVRVHFLRCGGLLDDWSVEGVLAWSSCKRHLSDTLVPTQSERPN